VKIVLTGASSFTGCWFARKLAEAGHEVVATFTGASAVSYEGVRARRVAAVLEQCRGVFDCRFGDDAFLNLLETGAYDILCHHGADVTNYKSADFNVTAALARNCHGLNESLTALKKNGGQAFLITGSVFEGGEGAGSDGLPHFSPYGLSKALTSQIAEYACHQHGVTFAKFVIPNPFGPLEDERFTAYLMKCWRAGTPATVRTPDYVRDNIHVDALAKHYADFVGTVFSHSGPQDKFHTAPSGYVESQGQFAQRFAREMERRLDMRCELDLLKQTEFTEPTVRINTEAVYSRLTEWSERDAWDKLSDYYRQ
jgi:UDP-glucose 4-epimerase